MRRIFLDLCINLSSGLRLALFRRCRIEDFRVSLDMAVALLFLDLLLQVIGDYAVVSGDGRFNPYALPLYTFGTACFWLAVYVFGKAVHRLEAALALIVSTYSAAPLLTAAYVSVGYAPMLRDLEESGVQLLSWGALAYLMAVFVRASFIASGRLRRSALAGFFCFSLIWLVPTWYYGPGSFWYVPDAEDDGADAYAAYQAMDAEGLLYSQPQILDDALGRLRAGQPGVSEVFFLAFAGYAFQDVFLREVSYIHNLFDDRFGTRNRSLSLVNHLDTREALPLATVTNLSRALRHIGRLMNAEEDVLVLYLTSHGSKDHELVVDFWPLALNHLTSEGLRTMLDEAGIQWRVVIVSACYSGGFIPSLEDSRTLVATAAAMDRTSFGCSNEEDFTYFGEAVFKDQLSQRFDFLDSFKAAAAAIAERERRERLVPSMPQLFVGSMIAEKLATLERSLTTRLCGDEVAASKCLGAAVTAEEPESVPDRYPGRTAMSESKAESDRR